MLFAHTYVVWCLCEARGQLAGDSSLWRSHMGARLGGSHPCLLSHLTGPASDSLKFCFLSIVSFFFPYPVILCYETPLFISADTSFLALALSGRRVSTSPLYNYCLRGGIVSIRYCPLVPLCPQVHNN